MMCQCIVCFISSISKIKVVTFSWLYFAHLYKYIIYYERRTRRTDKEHLFISKQIHHHLHLMVICRNSHTKLHFTWIVSKANVNKYIKINITKDIQQRGELDLLLAQFSWFNGFWVDCSMVSCDTFKLVSVKIVNKPRFCTWLLLDWLRQRRSLLIHDQILGVVWTKYWVLCEQNVRPSTKSLGSLLQACWTVTRQKHRMCQNTGNV